MKEQKHNHKGTKILKVLLYALVMLMPLSAVASETMYATLNKNANQSATLVNETRYITPNVLEYMQYVWTGQNATVDSNNNNGKYCFEELDLSHAPNYTVPSDIWNYDSNTKLLFNGYLQHKLSNTFIWYQKEDETWNYFLIGDTAFNTEKKYLTFIYIEQDSKPLYEQYNSLILQPMKAYGGTLDQTFYNACRNVSNNELFSWTHNTAVYQTIRATTQGLGIQSTFYTTLFTYWFLMTCIYIIIDIIIETFTCITHFISQKH